MSPTLRSFGGNNLIEAYAMGAADTRAYFVVNPPIRCTWFVPPVTRPWKLELSPLYVEIYGLRGIRQGNWCLPVWSVDGIPRRALRSFRQTSQTFPAKITCPPTTFGLCRLLNRSCLKQKSDITTITPKVEPPVPHTPCPLPLPLRPISWSVW